MRERLERIIGESARGPGSSGVRDVCRGLTPDTGPAIDLLVTDLRLPDGHGVQAIRALRDGTPGRSHGDFRAGRRPHRDRGDRGPGLRLSLKDSDPINIIDAIADLWPADRRSRRRSRAPSCAGSPARADDSGVRDG